MTPIAGHPAQPNVDRPRFGAHPGRALALAAGGVISLSALATPALAQPPAAPAPATPAAPAPIARAPVASLEPFEDRLIREVRVDGLIAVNEQLVRNQLRAAPGRPMKAETVQSDVARLTRLGRFREVSAAVQPFDDQTVAVVYTVVETPVIKSVEVAGNRQLSDQEIAAEVNILAGTPVDKFQIDRALRKIKELYKQKGYYQADVALDDKELAESQILLFRIREGERLRVTDIRFDGNKAFADGQIRSSVNTSVWNIFSSGTLDDATLDQDVANIISYYKDRGYLDVRVDRAIRPSPDGKEAIITFIIEEGRLYTLRSVRAELDAGGGKVSTGKPTTVYTQDQLAGLMLIKAGDVYSQDKIRKSVEAVTDGYGKLGYADVKVNVAELRDPANPEVDLLLLVSEGRQYQTGLISIRGNELTRQNVIRRQLRIYPDRPLDSVGIRDSELRLRELGLFAGNRGDGAPPRLTIQPEREDETGYRDVLVELQETNTGSLSFGAAVSSDQGLVGSIVLKQDNFDIGDWPDSFDEFVRGRAFRGGGQQFNLTIAPGTVTQNYSLGISEPYLFESDYSGSAGGGFSSREFDNYREQRLGGQLAIGRRFGQVWSGSLTFRAQDIDIGGIDDKAILDLQDVEGHSLLTGIGVRLRRTTLDSNYRPSRGSRIELGVERVGAAGGDYQFTKLSASGTVYFTMFEDFMNRKTILNLRTATYYIPEDVDEVPIFERYFLGGRDFRGFDFRGVSPRALKPGKNPGDPPVVSDQPAGGTWSFFIGAEVEHPIIQEIIKGVVFIDSGTVTNDPGFEDYRLSVGVGLRLYLEQLGPVPLAFDFGFPLLKQDGDQTQLFSFSLDLPF